MATNLDDAPKLIKPKTRVSFLVGLVSLLLTLSSVPTGVYLILELVMTPFPVLLKDTHSLAIYTFSAALAGISGSFLSYKFRKISSGGISLAGTIIGIVWILLMLAAITSHWGILMDATS